MELLSCYTVYLIILTFGQLQAKDRSEPECYSNFDYQEKLLYKMIKIEDVVTKFQQYIDELKVKEETQDLQRKQEHEQYMVAINQMDAYLENLYSNVNNSMKALDTEHAEFVNNVTRADQPDIKIYNSVKKGFLPDLYRILFSPVAFTVKNPEALVGSYVSFAVVVTNEGNGFDATTGKFTCKVPGLYYFSFHVLKIHSSSADDAYCRICKNGSTHVIAFTGPQYSGENTGYYGASSSVNLVLVKNDVVGLCSCSSVSHMYHYSSFSGHLVTHG